MSLPTVAHPGFAAFSRPVRLRRPPTVTTEVCALGTELRALLTDFRLWAADRLRIPMTWERSHAKTVSVERLYREYRNWAMRVAIEILGHEQDAEDVVSEVFASIVRARAAGGGPSENVKAYLRTAIQREATRLYARRMAERHVPQLDAPTQDDLAVVEIFDALRRGMAGKPATWSHVLELIDLRGYTHAEVATALGVSERALHSTLRRARVQARLAIAS